MSKPRAKPANARGIIAEYLKAHGYDGLCNQGCGCGLGDLPACGDIGPNCKPAYKVAQQCEAAKAEDFGGCYSEDGTCPSVDGWCRM